MASQQPQPPAGEVAFIPHAPFCVDRRRASQLAAGAAVPYARMEGAAAAERPWGDENAGFRYHVPAQPPAQRVAEFYSAFPGLAASLGAGAPSQALASALGLASPAAPLPWRFARLRHGPHPPLPSAAAAAAAASDAAAPPWAENGPLGWVLAHYFLNDEDSALALEEEEEGGGPEGGPALPPPQQQQQLLQQQGQPAAAGGGAAPAASSVAAVEDLIALPAPAPPRLPCLHLGPPF